MVNTPKHPQHKAYEDTVVIERLSDGKLRLQFSVDVSKSVGWYKTTTPQKKMRPGLSDTSENYTLLEGKCLQMHLDFLNGCFDPTLVKYGIGKDKPQLSIVPPIKKEIGMLELYDKYVEYRGKDTSINTHHQMKVTLRNAIEQAINTVGENALEVRSWLLNNRCKKTTKECLRFLSKAHKLGVKHGLCFVDPFDEMSSEVTINQSSNKFDDNHEADDEDIFNQQLSYTLEEMEAIIDYGYDRELNCAALIEFLFLTGSRISEAIAIKWSDIKWERESLIIARQWSMKGRCFIPLKGTKNLPEHLQYRIFPMPKNEKLWNLIKSIEKKENKLDLVFVNGQNNPFSRIYVGDVWRGSKTTGSRGIVPELIKQGKVSKYFSIHHTRHTFSCIQQNVCGIDPKVVSSWCGHHPEVNSKHYWEADRRIKPGYGELLANQSFQQQSEIEILKQQNKLQQEQMEEMKMMIEKLTRDK
ncbi:tyrosine-type recombinase/integrase [Nostoc sp. CALU 1950]|uniref:tyrosine-type recombinase/integrase n=1 Tax=Nostoc sp. CALU 1950 TaxID=3104321 RepID=UPI003EC0529B